MKKAKFGLYFILTSFIWGPCIYLTTVSFKESWYALSIMFFVIFTEIIRELIFKTEEEKEREQKRKNQAITFNMMLKGLLLMIITVCFIILFIGFYKSFNNTTLIIMYFIIAVIWFSSLYRAWPKS